MVAMIRTPKRYGTDFRARKRPEPSPPYNSECVSRQMTPAERAWMDSLPKPHPKSKIIGMSIAAEKAMKRKGKGYVG